ncbi:hypothetical protein CHS0354_041101, partial [Potamilus streckersoni]
MSIEEVKKLSLYLIQLGSLTAQGLLANKAVSQLTIHLDVMGIRQMVIVINIA